MQHLTRDEHLVILRSLDVDLPPSTKLPEDALDKRLKHALNCAQDLPSALPSPLDFNALKPWPSGKKMHEITRRGNMQEAMKNLTTKATGLSDPFPLYVEPFLDLRQTYMSITNSLDNGRPLFVMQDRKQEESAINMRVVTVHELNDRTPIIVVLYYAFTKANPLSGLQWVQYQFQQNSHRTNLPKDYGINNVHCTLLEQKLMLKLLAMNAKHVPSNYKLERTPVESGFKLSFLLPLGPLSYEDIAKLNSDTGCAVCGEKMSSRCKQCLSISYCGQACQRADWPTHKAACRSLKGGTWLSAHITKSHPQVPQGMIGFTINRHNLRNNAPRGDDSAAPPNIHSEKHFLIKLQRALAPNDQGNFYVYDRQRSIDVFITRDNNPEVYETLMREVLGPRGGYQGLKMYRYARRKGDWELSICVDKAPAEVIKW